MLPHYLVLALRSFSRNGVLTSLIVLTIGLGVGASMTMITVLHVMSADPLPGRSARLFYPHLEPGPLGFGNAQLDLGSDFTWPDAQNLLRAHRAVRQAMMSGGRVAVSPGGELKGFFANGRYTSAEFFAMFGTSFAAGTGWNVQADEGRARVVVLNGELARKLFGSADGALGKILRMQGREFRVTGVLRDWHPEPLFYSGASGDSAFRSGDAFFLPLATAMDINLPIAGGEFCWGDGGRASDQCSWLQFWAELDRPDQVAAYRRFLLDYWRDQKAHGRFPQNQPPKLYGMMQRLRTMHLVSGDLKLQLWLAIGFLGVCLFNTVGLMLAKFLRKRAEVSVRRAMGATRRDIFLQLGSEAGMLGLASGVIGLLCTWFGLWLVRRQPDAYAQLVHLDLAMVLATFILTLVASVLAGLVPAWFACRIPPALELKVQ